MSEVRVTPEQIEKILSESVIEDLKIGTKTTVVHATLPTGFIIVESSSCVDPDNYDHELGRQICMKRIEDKIWMLEGYFLQKSIANGPFVVEE